VSVAATRKRPLTAKEDLTEAKRRAKTARTPIAKVVTQQVVEKKQRLYAGEPAKEARAQTGRAASGRTGSSAARTPQKAKTARSKRASK
jgi:hypothetical protein